MATCKGRASRGHLWSISFGIGLALVLEPTEEWPFRGPLWLLVKLDSPWGINKDG